MDDNLVGLKPGSLFKELNAALKRRSSTVLPAFSLRFSGFLGLWRGVHSSPV
jgi:hypothetical protein